VFEEKADVVIFVEEFGRSEDLINFLLRELVFEGQIRKEEVEVLGLGASEGVGLVEMTLFLVEFFFLSIRAR